MTIPKIVHLCWFGGGKTDQNILRCEASLQLLVEHGYKIIKWNESNYDLNKSSSLKEAYDKKKWSLISNYVRLDVLKNFGGVYLDTDIEIIRSFDKLLVEDFFIGFMWDCTLGTAVIGAAPMNNIICDILNIYDSEPNSLTSPNNNTFTDYFLSNIDGFKLNGKQQLINKVLVLDKLAFEHPSLFNRKNYTIHHFSQSWIDNSYFKERCKKVVISLITLWLYRKYVCFNSRRISKYYNLYMEHIQTGRRQSKSFLHPLISARASKSPGRHRRSD